MNILQAELQEALLRYKKDASQTASNGGIITGLKPCVRSHMEIILKMTTMKIRYTFAVIEK